MHMSVSKRGRKLALLTSIAAGAVGEPDDRERRQSPLEVRFNLHPAGVQPDKRVRDRSCEHRPTLESIV